jgi:DNA-binding NarL/FixJ family response regulator
VRLAWELHAAIRKVATEPGHVVLSVTAPFLRSRKPTTACACRVGKVQILSEAADALSNRQIAHRLGVTEGP